MGRGQARQPRREGAGAVLREIPAPFVAERAAPPVAPAARRDGQHAAGRQVCVQVEIAEIGIAEKVRFGRLQPEGRAEGRLAVAEHHRAEAPLEHGASPRGQGVQETAAQHHHRAGPLAPHPAAQRRGGKKLRAEDDGDAHRVGLELPQNGAGDFRAARQEGHALGRVDEGLDGRGAEVRATSVREIPRRQIPGLAPGARPQGRRVVRHVRAVPGGRRVAFRRPQGAQRAGDVQCRAVGAGVGRVGRA